MRILTVLLFFAAAVFGVYGCWSIWQGIEAQNWAGAAYGVVPVVAGVGGVLRKPWSRWVALAISVLFLLAWLYFVWLAFDGGVYAFERPLVIALSLVPGLAMIAVGFACVFVYFRYFRARRIESCRHASSASTENK